MRIREVTIAPFPDNAETKSSCRHPGVFSRSLSLNNIATSSSAPRPFANADIRLDGALNNKGIS
jgi:hypothetical protein